MPGLQNGNGPAKSFNIAIVGGGIAGLTLAIALHHRNIPVRLYERAARFEEIGAGVSFAPNAIRAMQCCHPGVYKAFETVCTRNEWSSKQKVWFDYVDGTASDCQEAAFSISTSLGQNGVHRAHFLDELVKEFPAENAHFGKQLDNIAEGSDGELVLTFVDGTMASATAVIGCDGIRSRVREFVVGASHPSVHPSYSHKYAYRGLVPMDKAMEVVGEERAKNAVMYMGQDAHVLTFSVDHGQKLNIVAFKTSPEDWVAPRMTKIASRQDALRDFEGFGPQVRGLLELTQPELPVWAIFDTGDHPMPTFANGRICIAGDAAHATSPHHGSGAGFCIEDSAVLAELLADERVQGAKDIEAVFEAYDQSRRERCQWLVQSSRRVGDCYEWRAEGVRKDFKKIESEINERMAIISNADIDKICHSAKQDLYKKLSQQ